MNDAKSMLMMYSYTAMKAAEDKEEIKSNKDTTKAETKTKSKRRGDKNDKGTEGTDSAESKE